MTQVESNFEGLKTARKPGMGTMSTEELESHIVGLTIGEAKETDPDLKAAFAWNRGIAKSLLQAKKDASVRWCD